MPTLQVQTDSETLYTRLSDALATNKVALSAQACEDLTAMIYPILFTKDGLSTIEGHSDHSNAPGLAWACTCGETFSTTFDGRDERDAHRAAHLLSWDQIITLVDAEIAMALDEDDPVGSVVIDLFRSMGQYWLFPGLNA
jgi:hypothetical protein